MFPFWIVLGNILCEHDFIDWPQLTDFFFACLMASTFSCACAIISSTSGILIAMVGLMIALITFTRIGRLTICINAARLSAASAACLCTSACSLQIFPIHFLIALTCSLFFPSSSSSTNSNTSWVSSTSFPRLFVGLCPCHLLVFQDPLPFFH